MNYNKTVKKGNKENEMTENNKKQIPGFIVNIIFAFIGAILALGGDFLIQNYQHHAEKAKISNFINGCMQNDLDRIQKIVDYFKASDKEKLHESTFSWQHESVLIQTISEHIGALDISIVKEFNNYVIMISQSKAFRESLRQALIKNDNNVKKVKLELKAYILGLESQIKIGKKIIDLINENN